MSTKKVKALLIVANEYGCPCMATCNITNIEDGGFMHRKYTIEDVNAWFRGTSWTEDDMKTYFSANEYHLTDLLL